MTLSETPLRQATVRNLALIGVIYTLAHGLILFNRGVFWDDWVIHATDPETILGIFRDSGEIIRGQMHLGLLLGGTASYRAAVFLSYLLAAYCLYAILARVSFIDGGSRFLLVLLFALFPVNSARVAMINTPAAIFYASFYVGFFLLAEYTYTERPIQRILSLLAFFFSFSVNSLLVFYAVPLAYLAWHTATPRIEWRRVLSGILRYLDFTLLPLLFWLVKLIYYKPQGLYDGRNEVTWTKLAGAITTLPEHSLLTFRSSFTDVIDFAVENLIGGATLAIFVALVVCRFIPAWSFQSIHTRHKVTLVALGVILFLLAGFPYFVVDKTLALERWYSKNQILLPLGAAFILVYGLAFLRAGPLRHFLQVFLVIAFISANIQFYLAFQRDWYKQASLIALLSKLPEVRQASALQFRDNTTDLNANHRQIDFYEFSGILKEAFGDERRFGLDITVSNKDQSTYTKYFTHRYKMGDYRPKSFEKIVEIGYGSVRLEGSKVVRLLALEFFRPESFHGELERVLTIHVHDVAQRGLN